MRRTHAPHADLEPSAVYGAEHLLRLFVTLPGIVAQTSMDARSIALIRSHANDLLAFLAREQPRLFARTYIDPSPAYHRAGAT